MYMAKGLSIDVLSCFEATSRRRRWDDDEVANRRAFRLCVCEDDRSRLLDPTAWPDSVIVSEWFLKLNSRMRTNGLKWTPDAMINGLRSMNVNRVQQQAAGDAAAAAAAAVVSVAQDDAYSDDTILAAADMDCIGDDV